MSPLLHDEGREVSADSARIRVTPAIPDGGDDALGYCVVLAVTATPFGFQDYLTPAGAELLAAELEDTATRVRRLESGDAATPQRTRDELVDAALDAAFPGLPDGVDIAEARRRIEAAIIAVEQELKRRPFVRHLRSLDDADQ